MSKASPFKQQNPICLRCRTRRPLRTFSHMKRVCDDCYAVRARETQTRKNDQLRRWRRENPERIAVLDFRSALKRLYGLSLEEYEAMLQSQNNRCAICRTDDPRQGRSHRRFSVDHDHHTGKVRGLLCSRCNAGLGFFKDHPDLLITAFTYLCRDIPLGDDSEINPTEMTAAEWVVATLDRAAAQIDRTAA